MLAASRHRLARRSYDMTSEDESLVEQVASAFRHRDPFGRILESPAFADLDAEGRERAYEVALEQRRLEAALEPQGLSTTAKLVLARIAAVRA
jgi:hypothetical protein